MTPLPGPALVVGGGTMGTGIAARLVATGTDTVVLVRREAAIAPARAEVTRRLASLARYHLAGQRERGRLTVRTGEPAARFILAVESVAEDPQVKRSVLAIAEKLVVPGGIVATNTSSLPLAALAEGLARPELFAGWHWFNPAELVPLVEVVGGPRTAPQTLDRLAAWSAAAGKEPVRVRRDVPGFIANRLQYALLREAYALVEAGVCDVADVDRAVVSGLGARWASIGPFTSMDAAGLDVHEAVAARLFPELSNGTSVPQLLRQAREHGARLSGAWSPQAAARRDDVLALQSRAVP